jgi:amino acid transporter
VGAGYLVKRAALGRPLATSQLAHERLGKPTALAVFASDNLSSVAYATEEILKVAVPVIGLAAFGLVMPITFAILGVLAILLFSYRQTIRAYPSAGGAYVVTKDNFGLLPAQVAGVALLTDYVLTVSVSISAGVAAITSAASVLSPYRVPLSVMFIWLIAWGNLRGVRESGRIFAVPTYFFLAAMFLLLGVGVVRALAGDLHPIAPPEDTASVMGAVGLFLVLHAFASGGAAVTGVEAISNGVPAFRHPEWKNARTTLVWMGSLLGVMFLGLSYLAVQLRVVPTQAKTVISQVGRATFGASPAGYGLFLALQIATTMILILAANTSFADFPRLANFQAGDNFMPRQLTTRGHRLVFSNGIVGLAFASTVLVVAFQADVHRLIPLYAIGVFTSFTLSQAGMAKRHLRLRETGWRRGLLINGLGAVTTALVTLIVAVTKFWDGAWAVMIFVPLTVWLLVRMNRRYEREREELDRDLTAFDRSAIRPARALLLVEDLDRKTLHAVQYAKTLRGSGIEAVHVERDPVGGDQLRTDWNELVPDIPLRIVRCDGDVPSALAGYVAAIPEGQDVNVIVPGPAKVGALERLRRGRAGGRIARALVPYEHVRITVVRDHPGTGHTALEDANGIRRLRLLPRRTHQVVVLIDRLDRAALRAITYALSLGGVETRAVHAAADPRAQGSLASAWMEMGLPIPLEIIECWDRNVPRALERYVVEQMASGDREVTVVIPRRDFAQMRQRLLHDRTSRTISRVLGRYEHVDVTVVPYYLGRPRRGDRGPARGTAPASDAPSRISSGTRSRA